MRKGMGTMRMSRRREEEGYAKEGDEEEGDDVTRGMIRIMMMWGGGQ